MPPLFAYGLLKEAICIKAYCAYETARDEAMTGLKPISVTDEAWFRDWSDYREGSDFKNVASVPMDFANTLPQLTFG